MTLFQSQTRAEKLSWLGVILLLLIFAFAAVYRSRHPESYPQSKADPASIEQEKAMGASAGY